MTMIEFLSRLRNMDVKLWVEGDNLRYQAPKGKMDRELLQEISGRKSEIISFLKQAGFEARDMQEPIPVIRREGGELPVSFSQQSLWFYAQLVPDSPVYNIPNAVRITGALEEGILKEALSRISLRHESLRTIFKNAGGKPTQEIIPSACVSLGFVDLIGISGLGSGELQRLMEEEAWKPFDLEKCPLWRVVLYKLQAEEYVLLLTIHHIISDAWSNGIFVKEFFAIYEALASGKTDTLPPLSIQFADYAAWQRERFERQDILQNLLTYWKKQLDNPTVLELPTDYPRPAVQSFSGNARIISLPEELCKRIKAFCLREDVTFFMLLLAAFKTLLHRYSGQEDILAGTVVANRSRIETAGMLGFIMNTLVLRTDFSGNPTFKEVLQRVKKMTLDAYAYQEIPFDILLEKLKPERDLGRTPLFQVMYIHQNTGEVVLNLPGFDIKPVELQNKVAPFDLRLITEEKNGCILCRLDYCSDLFRDAAVERMLLQYERIIDGMISNPLQKIDEFSFLSQSELKKILVDFNNTSVSFPTDRLIHQMFEDQVQKTPHSTALVFEGSKMSYGELNCRANRLAHHLKKLGVGPDVAVGVCIERSFEMVISLMGILKAGGAYVPFDPNYPKDRVEYMIRDARVNVLITFESLIPLIPEFDGELICLDREDGRLDGEKDENPACEATDGNLAYIIYTSGSTGEPKGAMNTHLGMRNHKQWMQYNYKLTANDRVLQKTPFSFDVSVWEFFWPLITGACLVVAKPEGHKDPGYLVRTIVEENITVIHFVPPMLSVFLEHTDVRRCVSLRHVFCSGEALSIELQHRFFNYFDIPLHNVYGPAECADVSTAWTCRSDYSDRIVPIGRPISNVQTYILDKHMNPLPLGVAGELCVGGAGVGRGYINKPGLTEARFVSNPFSSEPGAVMYKTGDLARYLEDGVIEYMGRSDFQVKIRGMRIELTEIERVLAGHPAIKECTLNTWEKQPGSVHLVCYAVSSREAAVKPAELQAYLGKSLPDYMVPRIYVFLEKIPLLPNGKINRKELPAPVFAVSEGYAAPGNELENRIADIWKEELGLACVGTNDNFFEIGGHSLLLTKVHNRLNKEFGKEFSLIDLFTHSTISALAAFISREGNETPQPKEQERIHKQREAKLLRRQIHRR